ncbi:hypothetical protein T06_1750, partial [Trichinella sp. T6]
LSANRHGSAEDAIMAWLCKRCLSYTLVTSNVSSIEVSECFAKQVERYKDRLERIWSKGDTYVKSKSGNEWRWTNLANGKAIPSEEVAILQSKKSTESQQLSGGHRQAVKKMVLNNVINVSKKLEKLGAGDPGGWLARTANEWLAHSGCYDFDSIDLAMVIWRFRPSGGFFWYFIDPQLALGHSDLADGVRVLFSSYRRLLAASPYLGPTD